MRDTQVTSWAPEVAHAWDANEQLAEMLLMRGSDDDVVEALEAYEMAIDIYPNRYHSTAGAAKCADMLGDDVKASSYYGDVSTIFEKRVTTCMMLFLISASGLDLGPFSRRDYHWV